jgi:uncharacterized protein YdhG (YjbR/CyaY superfamily)
MIEDYLARLPDTSGDIVRELRGSIRLAIPLAEESISYQMLVYRLNSRPVLYLAGWQHHVALYGVPILDDELEQRLKNYRGQKGTLRFPLTKPFPYDLITHVVMGAAGSATPVPPRTPRTSGEKRPRDQQRLEQQANTPGDV